MAERSKRILLFDKSKLKDVNQETLNLMKKYRIDMELRELSPGSIHGYENDLNQWFIYIYDNQNNRSVTELDEDDLTEFFYFCKKEGNNSRRMRRRMASISAFYNFLQKKRLITSNPMMFIDRPQKDTTVNVQTFLTKEQVTLMRKKLQKNVDNDGYRARDIQLYALFSLSTMARVNAVSNTRWDQIDFKQRTVEDVLEKEGKIVTLYFSEEVGKLLINLKKYREKNHINDGGYVFYSETEAGIKPITTTSLTEWCKRIGAMINVPTLHPHDFRHSGSQLLKLAGCPIEEISVLLNHESVDTTRKFYLRQDKQKLKETKDKYSF